MTAPTTVPAAGPTRAPQPSHRARRVRALLAVLALVVLLTPLVYLFGRLWTATDDATDTTGAERAALAYARPVDKLLAALVAAQYTAARGAPADLAGVRSAVEAVNTADRRAGDPLDLRPRWTQLRQEIDNSLSQNPAGADALHVYAAPISLTQALLDRIADASEVTRDPAPGAFQLTQVALRSLPDVLVNAGQVSALALTAAAQPESTGGRAAPPPDTRLPIAEDRLTRAAGDVSTGLRGGTDPAATYAVDLNLLGPLDEFAAAADELAQTAKGLSVPGSGARDRIEAAYTGLESKVLTLESAVFDAFDSQVVGHATRDTGHRRTLLAVAAVTVAAAAALLWLAVPRPAGPVPLRPDENAEGRHRYPAEGSPQMPDLVDARELLNPVGHQ
jgi:hypothetical protein